MTKPFARLAEISPPGAEPLLLDEVKTHLRIDHDTEDESLQALIAAARESCESFTGRALITRTYSLYLDSWPEVQLALPRPPLVSVVEINTYDEANAVTVFSSSGYFVDTAGAPARIVLKDGVSPPEAGRAASGIEIRFKAGYGTTPQSVPAPLRQGMKQMAAYLYEHRGDGAADALKGSGAQILFQPYRVLSII